MKKFLIVLAILVIAVFMFFSMQKQPEKPLVVPPEPNPFPVFRNLSDCAKEQDENTQVYCYNVIALKDLDSSLCVKNTEPLVKDWCYYNIAVKMQDKKLCGKIVDLKLKADCEWETP